MRTAHYLLGGLAACAALASGLALPDSEIDMPGTQPMAMGPAINAFPTAPAPSMSTVIVYETATKPSDDDEPLATSAPGNPSTMAITASHSAAAAAAAAAPEPSPTTPTATSSHTPSAPLPIRPYASMTYTASNTNGPLTSLRKTTYEFTLHGYNFNEQKLNSANHGAGLKMTLGRCAHKTSSLLAHEEWRFEGDAVAFVATGTLTGMDWGCVFGAVKAAGGPNRTVMGSPAPGEE